MMCSLAYFITYLGFIFLLMVYLLVHYCVLLHHSDFIVQINVCSICPFDFSEK